MKRYLRPILVCGLTQVFTLSLGAMNSDLPAADGEIKLFALLNIVDNYNGTQQPQSMPEASGTHPHNNSESSSAASESAPADELSSTVRHTEVTAPGTTEQSSLAAAPSRSTINFNNPLIPKKRTCKRTKSYTEGFSATADVQPIVAPSAPQTLQTNPLANLPDLIASPSHESVVTLGEALNQFHAHYLTQAVRAIQPTTNIHSNGTPLAANQTECLIQ